MSLFSPALLVGIPLMSAAVLLLLGKRTNAWGHLLGTAASIASFGVAVAAVMHLVSQSVGSREITQTVWNWFTVGNFSVDVTLSIDALSGVFILLITGVGSLIHIYSIGYMSHDENRRKFFAYLNLFIAAMLLLVLANNFLLLYVGWEGVGLASFLLIGFWQHKNSASTAANKAFILNRVGDFGLAAAVMLMFVTFGSVSFPTVFAHVGSAPGHTTTWIALALLLAACGKSAQFPLQSWLLDAMEGPTPVSALIHAATMVTAGVYLVARSNAIFDLTQTGRTAVMIVGTITLLMGAVIGIAKDDIKKALAGSTMSQIGYMMLAVGLGPVGYVWAIFHLLTHGFFKANMFLGAGSVMHGMNDDVNMRHYGALRKSMAITFGTFLIGYLAIIGVPPFAGFFSKDEIIKAAFEQSVWAGAAALLGAGITAYYMSRVMFMTFFGKARWQSGVHPHESPAVMTIPLIVLALLSAVAGYGLLHVINLEEWLTPLLHPTTAELPFNEALLLPGTLAVVAVGVVLAWFAYGSTREIPVQAPRGNAFIRAARADLGGDAFNQEVVIGPGERLTATLVAVDKKVLDASVMGIADTFTGLGGRFRSLQTGFTRSYALVMVVGVIIVGAVAFLVRLS